MRFLIPIFILALFSGFAYAETKTIHVFVALCDNENQGIVPVPKQLGNGQDPANNLYWGAAFGVKSFFKYKTTDWKLVKTVPVSNSKILERLLYKHKTKDVYMLADAYDGKYIKACTEDFLKASNGQNPFEITVDSLKLGFGGSSGLLAYAGHDGLMEFNVSINYNKLADNSRDVIILACYSKDFFNSEIRQSKARPILWTKSLMAPEAYSLKAAIDGWILKETDAQIMERAAQAYSKWQKCGIKGGRSIFTTGF